MYVWSTTAFNTKVFGDGNAPILVGSVYAFVPIGSSFSMYVEKVSDSGVVRITSSMSAEINLNQGENLQEKVCWFLCYRKVWRKEACILNSEKEVKKAFSIYLYAFISCTYLPRLTPTNFALIINRVIGNPTDCPINRAQQNLALPQICCMWQWHCFS